MTIRNLLLVVVLALLVSPAGAQDYFSDTFDLGPDPSWINNWGGWVAQNGYYQNTNICGYASCANPLWHGPPDLSDYIFKLEFTPTLAASPYGAHIAVMICSSAPDQGPLSGYDFGCGWGDEAYLARFDGVPESGVRLIETSGSEYHLSVGTTYVVMIGKLGDLLAAKIFPKGEGEPGWQLMATDDTYDSGYFGLSLWNTAGYLDNVQVYGAGPVSTEKSTWGKVKSLYR